MLEESTLYHCFTDKETKGQRVETNWHPSVKWQRCGVLRALLHKLTLLLLHPFVTPEHHSRSFCCGCCQQALLLCLLSKLMSCKGPKRKSQIPTQELKNCGMMKKSDMKQEIKVVSDQVLDCAVKFCFSHKSKSRALSRVE